MAFTTSLQKQARLSPGIAKQMNDSLGFVVTIVPAGSTSGGFVSLEMELEKGPDKDGGEDHIFDLAAYTEEAGLNFDGGVTIKNPTTGTVLAGLNSNVVTIKADPKGRFKMEGHYAGARPHSTYYILVPRPGTPLVGKAIDVAQYLP